MVAKYMAAIRSTSTQPEQRLSKMLRHEGIPFKRNVAELPGTPDVVFSVQRLAVFVHGCFWHGCPRCYVSPSVNVTYWTAKADRNRRRDRRAKRGLWRRGWGVVTVWECELERDANACVARILRAVNRRLRAE